ncbi:MAG: hypothetical protein WAV73_05080 [Candidatus Moraniibacteriota bacterium]
MQKNILKFALFFFSLIAAFFSWLSLNNAVTVPDSSVWLAPMIWFSLLYIVYSLELVIVSEKSLIILSGVLGFFFSLIFVQNFWHFVAILLAVALFHVSSKQIKDDLGMNVKLDLPKTLRMGKTFFMLALALVISSQYYFQAASEGLLKLPTFDAGAILENKWAKGILYKLNPDLQKLEDKNLTVDQMILDNYRESQANSGEMDLIDLAQGSQVISPANMQKIEQLRDQKVLEAGREQLGKMANRKLAGSEKVSVVMTEIMNQKIQSLVVTDYANEKFPAVPIGMALILFLTVLSLGAFMIRILAQISSLIFWILTSTNVVKIKMVSVEMEVIE